MDILPRYPHLTGTKLIPQDFVLQAFDFGKRAPPQSGLDGAGESALGIKEEAHSPSLTNGNGTMINGHK